MTVGLAKCQHLAPKRPILIITYEVERNSWYMTAEEYFLFVRETRHSFGLANCLYCFGGFFLLFFFFSISHTYYARKIMIFCIRNQNLGNLTPISAYMQNETHCRLSSGLFCLSAAWDWVSWDLLQWFQWVTWHSSFGRYYELALILGLTAI